MTKINSCGEILFFLKCRNAKYGEGSDYALDYENFDQKNIFTIFFENENISETIQGEYSDLGIEFFDGEVFKKENINNFLNANPKIEDKIFSEIIKQRKKQIKEEKEYNHNKKHNKI